MVVGKWGVSPFLEEADLYKYMPKDMEGILLNYDEFNEDKVEKNIWPLYNVFYFILVTFIFLSLYIIFLIFLVKFC